MKIMGNILIGVAMLIYFGMLNFIYGSQSRSGQEGVGYGMAIIIANFGFVLCLGIVTGIIGSKGGFSWVGSEGVPRILLVSSGFIVAMTGIVFFSLIKGSENPENFVEHTVRFVPVVLPLLLLASAAILLNDGWRLALPDLAYKLPLAIALVFGVLAIGWILKQSASNADDRIQAESDYEKWNYQNYLNNIDSVDVMKEIVFILGYTDANHYPEVRERALAKIKSRSDWQEELVRCIQTDWAPDVFTFLASNEVNDKTIFVEPLREGLFIQAKLIRKDISTAAYSSQLPSNQFFQKVKRALQTADRFAGMGTDYRPAVKEMRKAFDEPCSIKKPNFKSIPLLDEWLRKHG